jgi:hypothetical protein
VNLTDYARSKARSMLVASRTWLVTYKLEAAPCDLCPPMKRIASRTNIIGTHSPEDGYRICVRCLARVTRRRELEHHKYELRLYGLR